MSMSMPAVRVRRPAWGARRRQNIVAVPLAVALAMLTPCQHVFGRSPYQPASHAEAAGEGCEELAIAAGGIHSVGVDGGCYEQGAE
jgi:hypothetical protein